MGATPEGASSGGRTLDTLKHDGRVLAKAGIALFPVGAGKRPFLKWTKGRKNYVLEMADADDLREWLTDSRTRGWAALCGSMSRVLTLDVESAGMAYSQVVAVLDSLPAYCKRTSPHGGAHAFIRLTDAPPDYDWAGRSLAKVKTTHPVTGRPDGHTLLAEFRGHGQYAVVTGPGRPPLPDDFHPVEMTVAEWESLIAPIVALHDPSIDRTVAAAYAGAVGSAAPRGGTTAIGSGDTADILREQVVANESYITAMLDPGWEIVSVNADPVRVTLKRPDYGDGTDANESGNVQEGALVVFSESVPWLEPSQMGKAMSMATAVARCWYSGDFGAAMKAIEEAAEALVVDGVAPGPGSPLERWPAALLEAVHAGRMAYLDAAAALVTSLTTTGSAGGGAGSGILPPTGTADEPTPDDDDPLGVGESEDDRPRLQVVSGPGPSPEQERAAAAAKLLRGKVDEQYLQIHARTVAQAKYTSEVSADPSRRAVALAVTQHALELQEEARANLRRARQEAMAEGLSAQVAADIFTEPEPVPIWGRDKDVLWAEGQALTVVGSTGVGKSWLGEQLVRAMLGGEPCALTDSGTEVLGYPVRGFDRILYLAADRPTQIKGLMRAFLRDLHEDGRLGNRLVVWPGPTPVSPVGDPGEFLGWVGRLSAEHGWAPRPDDAPRGAGMALPDVIIFDSLKDFVPDLNQPTDPGAYNQTRQRLVSLGVEVLEMHHTKKGAAEGIDKAFGSQMIAAGSGSVLIMLGDPGATDVSLVHSKPPLNTIPTMSLRHDRDRYVTRVLAGVAPSAHVPDPIYDAIRLASVDGGNGITRAGIVEHLYPGQGLGSSSKEYITVKRAVARLIKDGTVAEVEVRRAGPLPNGTKPTEMRLRFVMSGPVSQDVIGSDEVESGEGSGEGPDAW